MIEDIYKSKKELNDVIFSIDNYKDEEIKKVFNNFKKFVQNFFVQLKINISYTKYKEFNETKFNMYHIKEMKNLIKVNMKLMWDDLERMLKQKEIK